jgi:hypothetical protein
MHPYEIDAEELAAVKSQYKQIPLKWRLSQFVGRNSVERKLHKLFDDFNFTSFEQEYYCEHSQSVLRNTKSNENELMPVANDIGPDNIVANSSYL